MTSPSGESKAFTFFRQLFFLGSIVLLTAGLGWNWGYHAKYRQGLNIHAKVTDEAFFNWHVVLMMFGFFLPNAIAAGAFRFFTFLSRDSAKWIHGVLNTVGFICSWVGYALVSMHQRQKYGIKFYQPHTWIGMFTMVIYTINWFMGAILYTNLKCVPGYIKAMGLPVHRALGSLSYVLIALSTFLGLFSNYAYDLKYDPDWQAGNFDAWSWKLGEFNSMLTLLVVGTSFVMYFFTDSNFIRPRAMGKAISPTPTGSSKDISGNDTSGLKKITAKEVEANSTAASLWVILNGKVYDLTNFDHPGGAHEILEYAGKDITKAFKMAGHGNSELGEVESHLIGVLEEPTSTTSGAV